MMPFFDVCGSGFLELMEQRLRGEKDVLVWPRQVRDLLRPYLTKGMTILEAGCCLGTAYYAFEATDVKYIGVDNEPKYLQVANEWYRDNPNVSFVECDITKGPLPPADAVICSATLEHCRGFQPAIAHMADAAKRFIILRTFLGDEEDIAYKIMPSGERLYVNQYAFRDIFGYLAGKGFLVRVYRDKWTDSIPQLQNDVVRTFYVVVGERIIDE